MSSNLPPSGGHTGPRQQQQQQPQNYPVPQPQHRHQGHSQYPRPQNWQQTQPNMSRAGPGQVPDPQFSYPLPQGMVAPSLHPHQHYQSSRRDSSQISPAESEFGQSTSPSETSDSQYSSHLIQYPPPQGYYPQMPPQANAFVPQPYALYPGQVAAHPQSWNQVQMPLQQQQPGSQMQFLPQLQQQQLQQWDANHPSHFQGYGYPHHYGSSSYASPTSSRNSSGRMEHLRSSGTSASGSGGRKSPRNNYPRQDSVAASLASSENSFSPYGNVPGQSPRPSDSSSPGNPPTTQGSSFGNTAPSQAETEPAPRSDFVLWCGNVPSDASVEELWTFFSRIPAEEGGPPSQSVSPNEREATQDRHGILSIFIISRSNCAFINYISDSHLQRALSYFHGKIIRPHDTRCQRLVVRIRKKGDEQMSGVSGQRGKGMHVAWIKEQERKKKEAVAAASALGNSARATAEQGQKLELPSAVRKDAGVDSSPGADSSPEQSKAGSASGSGSNPSISGAVTRPSPTHESSAGSIDSSNSFTSTNSSLFRHPAFRTRYFILKSANVEQLDKSVESGEWRTQPHNEAVLDQAFRNSEDVILVFSANQSGNFYGYAKMKGLISPHLNSDENPSSSSKLALSSTPKTETIAENDDEDALDDRRGSTLKPEEAEKSSRVVFSPQDGVAPSTTSPLPLTPGAQDSDSSNYFPPQTQEARVRTTSAAGGASWPPISNPPHQTEEERRASASPSMLVSLPSTIPGSLSSVPTTRSISETGPNPVADALPSRTSTATPTTPSGIPVVSVEASDLQPGSGSSSSTTHEPHSAPTTLGPAPIDQFGVTRRDMINGGSSLSSNSLGPQDSISWPDSRAFSELAIRAVIHNLRLEEKESLKEAREASAQSQQLESSLINKNENQSETTLDPSSQIIKSSAPAATGMDQVGKPFPIEWKETRALPFSVVRNLRNPWRDNRQIKVSRDGTELEPSVGKALLEEWEKAVRG